MAISYTCQHVPVVPAINCRHGFPSSTDLQVPQIALLVGVVIASEIVAKILLVQVGWFLTPHD